MFRLKFAFDVVLDNNISVFLNQQKDAVCFYSVGLVMSIGIKLKAKNTSVGTFPKCDTKS